MGNISPMFVNQSIWHHDLRKYVTIACTPQMYPTVTCTSLGWLHQVAPTIEIKGPQLAYVYKRLIFIYLLNINIFCDTPNGLKPSIIVSYGIMTIRSYIHGFPWSSYMLNHNQIALADITYHGQWFSCKFISVSYSVSIQYSINFFKI